MAGGYILIIIAVVIRLLVHSRKNNFLLGRKLISRVSLIQLQPILTPPLEMILLALDITFNNDQNFASRSKRTCFVYIQEPINTNLDCDATEM